MSSASSHHPRRKSTRNQARVYTYEHAVVDSPVWRQTELELELLLAEPGDVRDHDHDMPPEPSAYNGGTATA